MPNWTCWACGAPWRKPGPTVSILQGIKNKVGGAVHVEFAHGPQHSVGTFPPSSKMSRSSTSKNNRSKRPSKRVKPWLTQLQRLKRNDVAVLVLGEIALMSGEAASRSSLKLSGGQEELLEAVVATGKPVVLVLVNGRPLDISWAAEHVPAILETWYAGSQAGTESRTFFSAMPIRRTSACELAPQFRRTSALLQPHAHTSAGG